MQLFSDYTLKSLILIALTWYEILVCTGCSLEELWDLSAVGFTFQPDVGLLHDAAQYPNCDSGYVGSAVVKNTTLNTTTVAYYRGTTAGSSACFVCDVGSGYEVNATINERVCRSNGTWSGRPIICGTLLNICYGPKLGLGRF